MKIKNQKSKIVNCIVLCILIAGSSCSDQFLIDKKDYKSLVTNDVYTDPALANGVFGVLYKRVVYNNASSASPTHHASIFSNMVLRQQSENLQDYTEESAPTGEGRGLNSNKYSGENAKPTKAGNFLPNPPLWCESGDNVNINNPERSGVVFANIFQINEFIRGIDQIGRGMYDNPVFWDRLKGQAVFLRAWVHFDALRYGGGFPVYLADDDPLPSLDDRSVRMDVHDIIERICEDFEIAANLLPAVWAATEEGRFTSVAAKAMISRVRLYAASPVFNASWDNPAGQRWQAALDAALEAERAATLAGYGGSISSIDDWDRAFYGFNGVFNPEAILKIPKTDGETGARNNWEDAIRIGIVRGSNAGGIPAPDQILTQFPMKDGRRATVENGYDDTKFYRNRDPRFYSTFGFSGCEWPGIGVQFWLYAFARNKDLNPPQYSYTSDNTQTDNGAAGKSRAVVWKMADPNVPVNSEASQGMDEIEYRYAEILLNIAETYAAMGNTGECVNYLNMIRSRVGAGNVPVPADRYAAIEAVLYERRVELAYEGKRSWDMRRWLLYEGGAGFDPTLASDYDNGQRLYTADDAWGQGWKIYDGEGGRPLYTKNDNILTKLGLDRFSGYKRTSKIWFYNSGVNYDFGNEAGAHPLKDNPQLRAVTPIKRNMPETERNAAFDKLETFYAASGMQTVDPWTALHPRYAMESGTTSQDQNRILSWRAWYYVYPVHYDVYDGTRKGNPWIQQTAGWMYANANPDLGNPQQQNGDYYYCTPE